MINSTGNSNMKISSESYSGLFNQDKPLNEVFDRQVRVRFLQQSADYLGADLSDYVVQSLCSHDRISQ